MLCRDFIPFYINTWFCRAVGMWWWWRYNLINNFSCETTIFRCNENATHPINNNRLDFDLSDLKCNETNILQLLKWYYFNFGWHIPIWKELFFHLLYRIESEWTLKSRICLRQYENVISVLRKKNALHHSSFKSLSSGKHIKIIFLSLSLFPFPFLSFLLCWFNWWVVKRCEIY